MPRREGSPAAWRQPVPPKGGTQKGVSDVWVVEHTLEALKGRGPGGGCGRYLRLEPGLAVHRGDAEFKALSDALIEHGQLKRKAESRA